MTTDQDIKALLDEQEEEQRRLEERTNSDWVTPKEVAEHFGVELSTVYAWLAGHILDTTTPHHPYERYQITVESLSRLTDYEHDLHGLVTLTRRYIPQALKWQRRKAEAHAP